MQSPGPGAIGVPIPDVNVLFAAHVADHVHHDIALAWLRSVGAFATCATTEQGLLRLLSNPVANPGASVHDALAAMSRVRARKAHRQWNDDTSLSRPFTDTGKLRGHGQITDFHLLNLAARHDGILVTLDGRIEQGISRADRKFLHTLRTS